MSTDPLKRAAAERAVNLGEPGLRRGLGTGSTAKHFAGLLGGRVRDSLKAICAPRSEITRAQAKSLFIPLTTLNETPELDLTVNSADKIDPALRLIKDADAALLREKSPTTQTSN